MVKNEDEQFPGIPNKALANVILRTMQDAAFLKAAGIPLPEFKSPKRQKATLPVTEEFRMSTAGLGEYLRVSLEIVQTAADLRRQQAQDQGPKAGF